MADNGELQSSNQKTKPLMLIAIWYNCALDIGPQKIHGIISTIG